MRYTELSRLSSGESDDDDCAAEPTARGEPREDEPWGPEKNWRQIAVALLLTFNVGAVLSIHKVSELRHPQ